MSAIGAKRTSTNAPHMSAFGGKADITPDRKCPLMTQSGHRLFLQQAISSGSLTRTMPSPELWGGHAAAGVHFISWWQRDRIAVCRVRPRATEADADHWIARQHIGR